MTKKIVINVISTDMNMDYTREECLDSLEEFDTDIYQTIKDFGPELTQMGVQQNHEKELFLTQTENEFCIPHPVKSQPLRDFHTLIDGVNKDDVDLVLLAGKESTYVGDTMYETEEGFLREVLEKYCESKPESMRMFKYPVEYIQNILMSCAPYIQQYVPYTNEAGASNKIIGYSRKFAERFRFREDINPNEIINCHDALLTCKRSGLKVKYLRSQNFREVYLTMSDLINIDIWEQYNDQWRENMKRAIPKFTKNILRRKIEFIE